MRAPRGRSGSVAASQLLNSRISAREVSRDLRRSDLWSRQNMVLRVVACRAAFRTSAIAAATSGARLAGACGFARGSATSVTRGRVLPMCGSSGICRPKFHELPRPGSQSTRNCEPWPTIPPRRNGIVNERMKDVSSCCAS